MTQFFASKKPWRKRRKKAIDVNLQLAWNVIHFFRESISSKSPHGEFLQRRCRPPFVNINGHRQTNKSWITFEDAPSGNRKHWRMFRVFYSKWSSTLVLHARKKFVTFTFNFGGFLFVKLKTKVYSINGVFTTEKANVVVFCCWCMNSSENWCA